MNKSKFLVLLLLCALIVPDMSEARTRKKKNGGCFTVFAVMADIGMTALVVGLIAEHKKVWPFDEEENGEE